MAEDQGISRLAKRAIEAQAIAPLVRAMAVKVGWEAALAMLVEVNQQEAFQRGQDLAAEAGGNGIAELAREVAGWGRGGTLEMEVLEQTPTTFFFNVTRCPYHEQYRDLGLQDLGVGLSCCRDAPHARGYNPRLELLRTQTIMEGADHCDFRYHLRPT